MDTNAQIDAIARDFVERFDRLSHDDKVRTMARLIEHVGRLTVSTQSAELARAGLPAISSALDAIDWNAVEWIPAPPDSVGFQPLQPRPRR